MSIDIHVKSKELLEKLANAVHDRDPQNSLSMFSFKTSDLIIVENWLVETASEIVKSMGEY